MREPGLIVMAVYKPDPALLERQIQSIQNQSLREWNCLVGIDGDDPAALALIRSMTNGDTRFQIQSFRENIGAYRHFERLLSSAGDVPWVALADQDDVWHPEKLALLVHALATPGVTAVTSQARVVDDDGNVLGTTRRRSTTVDQALMVNQMTGAFTVLSPEVVANSLPFPDGTSMAVHDHWLAVVACALGRIDVVPARLVDYVQHANNVIGEAEATTLGAHLAEAKRSGGAFRHLDALARTNWGWRVSMARALVSRGLPPQGSPFVSAVASGRFSWGQVRVLLREWRQGYLATRTTASLVAQQWRFRSHSLDQSSSAI